MQLTNVIATKYFKNISKLDYLLYNIDEFYIFIIRRRDYNYQQYLIDDKNGVIDSSIVRKKNNKMLRRVFEKILSPCNFLYFEKDSIDFDKYNPNAGRNNNGLSQC